MKGKIVRSCAWFTFVFFGLTSIVGLIMLFARDFSFSEAAASVTCLLIAGNGWYARRFGLPGFKSHVFSKAIAVFSLLFGIALVTLVPIVFASNVGFEDSWQAIRNLLIMFLPVVISAVAILTTKSQSAAKGLISLKQDSSRR